MERKEGQKAAGEGFTVRLFSPLEGWFYDEEDYGTPVSSGGLNGYRIQIQSALKEDWIQEKEAGLAEYLPEGPLKEKVVRMHPSMEVFNCGAWGVLTVECTQELSAAELVELKKEWHGQMNDGGGRFLHSRRLKLTLTVGCM